MSITATLINHNPQFDSDFAAVDLLVVHACIMDPTMPLIVANTQRNMAVGFASPNVIVYRKV